MADAKSSPVLLTFKKEPLNLMEFEPEITTDVTLVTDDLLDLDKTNISIHHEIKEGDRLESSKDTDKLPIPQLHSSIMRIKQWKRGKKRLRKSPAGPSSQRTLRIKWFNKPELKEWLAPVFGKPNYVSCKWCKALLRAHLHDLKKHAATKKHRKQSLLFSNSSTSSCSKDEEFNITDLINLTKHSMEPKELIETKESIEDATSKEAESSGLIPVNIGFIGCGNMAQALISGFISNGLVDPGNLLVSAPSVKNLSKLKPLGIRTTHDNKKVVEENHMIFLAVKPHIIPEVLAQLEPIEGDHNPLFVSVASGLSITRLEAMLSHVIGAPRVIRLMPNTPCMVLQGCCVYSIGSNVQSSEGKAIKCLLGSVGLCEEVPENQIDAVCGLAGSGPAYIYAAIEAMADGGVKMGLPRNLSLAFAAQTVKGAATMVLETGKHPGQLKDEVCSPAGTTISAMHVLEKNGFRNALMSAVEASASRSKELG